MSTPNAKHIRPRGNRTRMDPPVPPAPEIFPEEPILARAGGRIFKLTPKALRTYANEYGLGSDMPFDLDECVDHIEMELEEALKGDAKPAYSRSRMIALESPSLVFKLVGSKIMNIRISLKYSSRDATKGKDGATSATAALDAAAAGEPIPVSG